MHGRRGGQAAALAAILLAACASSEPPAGPGLDGGPPVDLYELRTPTIEVVSPGRIALGDRLQVFGTDFIAPEHGAMRLLLSGTFHSDGGDQTEVRQELPLEVVNHSLAELEFKTLFADGQTGTFYGSATVTSRADMEAENAHAGEERTSKQAAVTLEVMPSIEVLQLRSIDSGGCSAVTEATNTGSELALELRVVGLGDASPDAHLTVRVGFLSPSLGVTYVKEGVYTSWPMDWHPGLEDSVFTDAPAGRNTMAFDLESGNSLRLDPHSGPIPTRISPSVQIRNEPQTEVLLGRMITGPVEAGIGASTITFFVEAERAGRTAERVVSLDVFNEFEVLPYDGSQRLVQRYAAEIPPGDCGSCMPGGDIGRDITYTEGESSSRTKSVSMRWDVNTANSVGLTAGHMVYAQAQLNSSWSSTFGTDVSEAVTTEDHRSVNITAHVLPTFYGICYRQLSRYEKSVDVMYHGECGASAVVGQAVLTDWGWGFDVATGSQCPPRTNLPEALSEEAP